VYWNGIELGRGCGCSKKEAQVSAAQSALEERLWERFEPAAATPKRKKKKRK
jgi:dsRNA-specific ribonuclease